MGEKILLEQIKKEQQQKVKEQFLKQKQVSEESFSKAQEKSIEKLETTQENRSLTPIINVFSSSTFSSMKQNEKNNNELFEKEDEDKKTLKNVESKSSSVIEKPNYDFIETLSNKEREKVFVFSEEKPENKPKVKKIKFKYLIISLLFALFGVWGIVNIATLDSLTNQYSINLATYLNNLHNLDATNSQNMENLFETIPDESLPPSTIGEKSNWFDRFCNFLAGLFGG